MSDAKFIDIVFDGPPGPVCGRFVETEDQDGKGIKAGDWVHREDGYWALRIANPLSGIDDPAAFMEAVRELVDCVRFNLHETSSPRTYQIAEKFDRVRDQMPKDTETREALKAAGEEN